MPVITTIDDLKRLHERVVRGCSNDLRGIGAADRADLPREHDRLLNRSACASVSPWTFERAAMHQDADDRAGMLAMPWALAPVGLTRHCSTPTERFKRRPRRPKPFGVAFYPVDHVINSIEGRGRGGQTKPFWFQLYTNAR